MGKANRISRATDISLQLAFVGEVLHATRKASPIHASENWERDAGNGGAFLRTGGRPRRQSSHDQQLKLRAILSHTSPDPLVAEQELVMSWRYYTQKREMQIWGGPLSVGSAPEERSRAFYFEATRRITFDPAHVKGVECIASEIEKTITQDVEVDASRWQAREAEDERLCKEAGPAGNLHSVKNSNQAEFRRLDRLHMRYALLRLLEQHRDYWSQRPTEPYDETELDQIFAIAFHDRNHALADLCEAWRSYLKLGLLKKNSDIRELK